LIYKPILSDFKIFFSEHNRKLAGPLNSFMGQLVPDGIKVVLENIS
jgi:hypothetical protein